MAETISAAARLDAEWWRMEEAKAAAAEAKTETYISEEELSAFEAMGETLGRELKKRDEIIERLQERLQRLEIDKVKHAGVWKPGSSLASGSFVTHSGSLWHVKKDHAQGTPGESPDFKLAVKRGEAR
jgi:predicted RNase H-like nuclease (RuvC/YqgF family)